MNLENIMLTEIVASHLCEVYRVGKNKETESRTVVSRSWEEGEIKSYFFKEYRVSVGMMKSSEDGWW